jgi:predicted Zn-dependent peptidase
MYDPYAGFSKYVLSNGLEVHFVYWDRPWIGAEIVVHSGGREDPVAIPGTAHFVEHMVTENIPNRKKEDVKEFFDLCGGRYNFGITSYLSTRYKFGVPANRGTFADALYIFGSMLLGARMRNGIERERKVILQEFNQKYVPLDRLKWEMATRKSLFKGHRLETFNRPLGRPEGFLSLTEANLQGFYNTHYVPANMSLVVIGGLPTDQVLQALESSPFGMQKAGVRNLIPKPLVELPIPEERFNLVKLSDFSTFKVDQAEYVATWAFPAHTSSQARFILSQILNDILFVELREKRGLAYSMRSEYQRFQDVVEFTVRARINPEAVTYIDGLVQDCIRMVESRADLFKRRITSATQECLMCDLSGADLAEKSADDLVLHHRIIHMQELWDELHSVTHKQVVEAVAFLNAERRYTFITAP